MSKNPFFGKDQEKAAKQAFSQQQLDQMKAMLDDPNVSNENKKNFLYVLSDAGQLSDEEIGRYSQQVGANPADVYLGGANTDENFNNARNSLGAAAEDKRNAEVKQEKGKVDAAQSALDQGGFSNSDQIIDQAENGIKIFDDFYPRFQRAGGQASGAPAGNQQQQPPNRQVVTAAPPSNASTPGGSPSGSSGTYNHTGIDPRSLREGLDEFRGIDFTAFHADAQMLTTTGGTVSDAADAMNKAWSANTSDWSGDAKDAAQGTNNALVKGSGDLQQALKTAPENISYTIDKAVQQNVINYAHTILDLYGDGKMAGFSVPQIDAFLDAKEKLPPLIKQLDDQIQKIENESWWDKFVDLLKSPITAVFTIAFPIAGLLGYSLAQNITEDNIKEEDEKYKGILKDAEDKLKQFCDDYTTKANSVHQQGATFVSGINDNYNALIDSLNKGLDPDPFATPGDGKGDGSTTPSGDTGRGKVDTGGGGGGGSIPAGGGGGAPSGGGGSVAPPPPPEPPATDGTKPEDHKPDDGKNPITGKPLEIDPQTGQPYPIDPKTGEAIKDLDDQDTMTVKKGDNTIAMSEPDHHGKMDVSVDDGHGHKHDYKLDFGDDKGADGKAAPTAMQGGFGPQGTPAPGMDGKPGPDGAYRPGPDGKIHIQDGDLKITAERPQGPDGPTVVTVDDGKGEPTTYTLDEKHGDKTDLKADAGNDPASGGTGTSGAAPGHDTGHQVQHDPGAESPLAKDPAPANPDPAMTQHASASGGFSTPGGLDLTGDLGGSATGSAGGDAVGVGAQADATTTTGAAGDGNFSSALSGSGTHNFADALSTEPGNLTGSSAVPDAGLGMAPGGDPSAAHAAVAGAGGSSSAASGMSGMGSMGGMMGGMGAAPGGGGGDMQRGSSQYRVEGALFETRSAKGRISGSLDDEGDRSISYER